MKKLMLAAAIPAMLATSAQAQTWKFDVTDFGGSEGKFYVLQTTVPGRVTGCIGNSGEAEISFGCRSADPRIQAVVMITGCTMNVEEPVNVRDRPVLISTNQFRNMRANGAIISFGKDLTITANLPDVSRFHAAILGSEGAFPVEFGFANNASLRTEFDFENSFSFNAGFVKFPPQCKM